MNWITDYVRPKVRALVGKPEQPENLWERCTSCGQMLFSRDLLENQRVCHQCDHHMRLPARKRLEMLFDNGHFTLIDLPSPPVDPLKFKDKKRYSDRLRDAQVKTGAKDAIMVAHGQMGSLPAVIAVFDFSFMGGSMGIAVGEAIVAAAQLAVLQEASLIIIPASGGARMQEGILSLMQMPRTTIAINRVKAAGLPYFVLLTDPTTGGVTASFAMLGDFTLAEPGSVIGFAGARVIESTVREKLPDGFQRAEYLLDHGMVDMVVHRHELREKFITLMDLLTHTTPPLEVTPMSVLENEDELPAADHIKELSSTDLNN